MCEMLVVGVDDPQPFEGLAPSVTTIERYGLAGFGWGVAWLADGGTVGLVRGMGRFADEWGASELPQVTSRRFLVHLRRPSALSTISMADTQPFAAGGRYAFCHNGFLDGAEERRSQYRGRLAGKADSEVGWVFFQDRLSEGVPPITALREVDEVFGGNVNLGYLGADGLLAVYSRSRNNRVWRFRLDGAEMAVTGLHSSDESIFNLVFPGAGDRHLVHAGSSSAVANGLPSAA